MDSKIREMIRMAAEDGKITDAEKKIILKKAAELGEDPDVVELAIEGMLGELQQETDRKQAKGKECPNCGAIIPAGLVVCPECHFSLVKNELNHTAEELHKDLLKIDRDVEAQMRNRSGISEIFGKAFGLGPQQSGTALKITRITTTVIPNTRADLLELLAYTAPKANKNGPKSGRNKYDYEENLGYAYWELFSNCVMMAKHNFENDPSFKQYFDTHHKMVRSLKTGTKVLLITLIVLLVCGGIAIGIILAVRSGNGSKQSSKALAKERVENCIRNHDYDGARLAAKKTSSSTYEVDKLVDDINAQEVSHLISIGNILQAKVVAARINDASLKASLLEALNSEDKKKPDSQETEAAIPESDSTDLNTTDSFDKHSDSESAEGTATDDGKEAAPDIAEVASEKNSPTKNILGKIKGAAQEAIEKIKE